jgi:hypothetical protein
LNSVGRGQLVIDEEGVNATTTVGQLTSAREHEMQQANIVRLFVNIRNIALTPRFVYEGGVEMEGGREVRRTGGVVGEYCGIR